MCSHSPPVGEANNCESVIEMRMHIDATPVCFFGCQPSAPSLRGMHSNAFVIIIRIFSSTQIIKLLLLSRNNKMTPSSCIKQQAFVITFSSFAISSGRWVNFSVNSVYLMVTGRYCGLTIYSLPCDIHTRDGFKRHKNQLSSL